jgi:hypothetical protein
MISKRTLEKYRKEALLPFDINLYDQTTCENLARIHNKDRIKILALTQELLDQQLLNKKEN